MNKWKLMLTTLPFVVVVTALKAGLEYGLGFSGVVEFGDVGVVLTGAVFLTGFLLAGTMADYKESEKLPGDVATTLEAIEELFVLAAANRPGFDGKKLQEQVLRMTDTVRDWLVKRRSTQEVFQSLTETTSMVRELELSGGAGPFAPRALPQLLMLRRALSRMDVISRTGFLPPAYALLEVLLAMILGLLLVAKFKSPVAEFILVPFVSLVNLYMVRLIKDIDDPFDYRADGGKRGGAEVDLFPIEEYRARLAARVGKG